MKKKDDDTNLLLVGAGAVAIWYFFIKPKTPPVPGNPGYTGYVPANAVAPSGQVTNTNAINALLNSAQKLLSPVKAASNTVSTQATENSAAVQNEVNSLFSTPTLNSINTGMPQTYAPPALNNNTIFNSVPAVTLPAPGPDTTSNAPNSYVAYDDSEYIKWLNGDYPGAQVSGTMAASIGEF